MRLRLGYAFDRTLIYATGGLAYADMVNTFQGATNPNVPYSWSGTGFMVRYRLALRPGRRQSRAEFACDNPDALVYEVIGL